MNRERGRVPKLNQKEYNCSYIKTASLESKFNLETSSILRDSVFKLGSPIRFPLKNPNVHSNSSKKVFASSKERVDAITAAACKQIEQIKGNSDPRVRFELLSFLLDSLSKNSGGYAELLSRIKLEYTLVIKAQLAVFEEVAGLNNKCSKLAVADAGSDLCQTLEQRIQRLRKQTESFEKLAWKLNLALMQEDSRFVLSLGDLHVYNVQKRSENLSNSHYPNDHFYDSPQSIARATVSHMIDPKEKWEFVKSWLAEHASKHPSIRNVLMSVQLHEAEYKVLLNSKREEDLLVNSILLDPESSKREDIALLKQNYISNCKMSQVLDEKLSERNEEMKDINQKIENLKLLMSDMQASY